MIRHPRFVGNVLCLTFVLVYPTLVTANAWEKLWSKPEQSTREQAEPTDSETSDSIDTTLQSGAKAAKRYVSKAWDDLWWTPDQQNRRKVERGDYESLLSSDDPAWSGVARYKQGEYSEASKQFNEASDITSQYNAATSMIHDGQYQEAIDKLNQVLEQNPSHQKARHNLDIAQQLMQLQEPPPPEGDDGESGDQQNQQGQDQQNTGNENAGDQQSSEEQGDSDTTDGADNQPESQQDQPGPEETESDQNQNPESSDAPDQQEQDESADGEETQSSQAEAALSEDQQATEQWLRRIPDDPTGLLRRKLRRSHQSEFPTTTDSQTPW